MPPAAPVLGAHVRKSLEIAAVRPAFALGLRAATATIAPLVVGDASGQPIFGWMALGGWLCAIADPGGPHLLRARTMAAFAAAAALVTGLGTVASTSSALSIALLFAGAIAASLARVGGEAAGTVGTTALILLCIALGSPAPPDQALPRVAMVLGGCALSTVLALLLWPVHAYRPARLAIASCYRELAGLAARIAEPSEDREQAWSALVVQQPPRVRAELERARVALGAVRRARNAESARGQQLVVLFETADVLLGDLIMVGEALAAAHTVDASWLRAVATALQGIADAIEDRAGPPGISLPGPLQGAPPEVEHARARLITTLQLALRVAAAPRRPDGGDRVDRRRHRRMARRRARCLGDRGRGHRPAARLRLDRPPRRAARPGHRGGGGLGRAAGARPAQPDADRRGPLPPLRSRSRAPAAQLC